MDKERRLIQIRGSGLNHFVLYSALLRLIDPVRGDPTRLLDENPDSSLLSASQLKKKFLDSFALICATSDKGAETAAAVCLETNQQTGNILRVARNHGFCPNVLASLENVLQLLRDVARKGTCFLNSLLNFTDIATATEKISAHAETEMLQLVVKLDRDRILSIAEKIEKRGIRDSLEKASSRLHSGRAKAEKLSGWVANHPFTAPPQNWSDATTAMFIDWAAQARWHHAAQLQPLLSNDDTGNQFWLKHLHKVARYHSAIKSMVKLAVKEPEIFAQISIKGSRAPKQLHFRYPYDENPLLTVRNIVGANSRPVMEQLENRLDTSNLEARLRRACRLDLTLHAEMQLVVFYEGNPAHNPCMRFIGTSKKACFLCDKYMRLHPLRLQTSASHQKIYPSWMPPPYYGTTETSIRTPFMKLSKEIEELATRELKHGLTVPRRVWNHDSTAGPSLTATATVPTELRSVGAGRRKVTAVDSSSSEDSE
ncbi:hypothetical protein FPSE_11077 [Fusarium pseudograminearum CS3096]|uniref:Uncharacterized protein n=2 Tax=Fusarium pseudograminearum TaxID=101028 RepID=K3UBG7_FUSPC|nr:hypothetical protein FPSE_11077 [Fusarium pseudograminearum CS3096]EKJ68746.1 hypothetical protein FPSE_11077 [Fusarium pseudograminearum CS3096]CEG03270.1 unnamed protein product [Fusarium pseudograminearum CS3487]